MIFYSLTPHWKFVFSSRWAINCEKLTSQTNWNRKKLFVNMIGRKSIVPTFSLGVPLHWIKRKQTDSFTCRHNKPIPHNFYFLQTVLNYILNIDHFVSILILYRKNWMVCRPIHIMHVLHPLPKFKSTSYCSFSVILATALMGDLDAHTVFSPMMLINRRYMLFLIHVR